MSLPRFALDLGDALGAEARLGAVVDVPERHPVVIDPGDRVSQREHLEPAGVGQDRAAPAHEAVEAAELGDRLVARAEVQVVGVAEHDLRAERLELGTASASSPSPSSRPA